MYNVIYQSLSTLTVNDFYRSLAEKLCNASMLVAASRELDCINTDAVMQAASDCELG